MRHNLIYLFAALAIVPGLPLPAVVDRVAVVIGKTVITESEVIDELRLTEFINQQPIDAGPAARREAAEHLVDQELIRGEMKLSGYIQPPANQADALLRQFRQLHYPSDAVYRAALQKYGITEDQLKARLLWQVTAIGFTDYRFRTSFQDDNTASDGDTSANRSATPAPAGSVDQQLDAWLKQTRNDTKIRFITEAFQ